MAEDNGPRIIGEDVPVRDRRQPKALLADVKKYAFIGGFALLVLFGIYGSCHKPEPVQMSKASTPMAPQLPTVQSEEAQKQELDRQLAQAQADTRTLQQQQKALQTQDPLAGQHDANLYQPGGSYQQAPEKTEAQKQADERKQREYRSLFASSIVPVSRAEANTVSNDTEQAPTAYGQQPEQMNEPKDAKKDLGLSDKPKYDFDRADGHPHRLTDGTIIEGALINRLSGDFTGPVLVQVTTNVYDRDLQALLIPQGSRFVGEATQVSGFGQQRLAVKFHRLIMPDGYSVSLDQFPGLSQEGETGLRDKVNSHYASIFGASLALGAIGGLAQIGNQGYGTGGYSPMTGFQNGVSESMAQSAGRVLDRFLNRLPTLTIRSGQRVKIFLTADLLVPEYANHRMDKEF